VVTRTSFVLIKSSSAKSTPWGMNPEEILMKEAPSRPHRVYAQPSTAEEEQVKALSLALKEMMRKEPLNARQHHEML